MTFSIVVILFIRRRKIEINVEIKKRLMTIFEIEWYELIENELINDEKNDFDDVNDRCFRFENFDFWLRRTKTWKYKKFRYCLITLLKFLIVLTKKIDWFHFFDQFKIKILWRKFSIFLIRRRTLIIKFIIVISTFEYDFNQKTSMINLKSYKRNALFDTFNVIDDVVENVNLKKNRYQLKKSSTKCFERYITKMKNCY